MLMQNPLSVLNFIFATAQKAIKSFFVCCDIFTLFSFTALNFDKIIRFLMY